MSICLSIVSHGQNHLANDLLGDVAQLPQALDLVHLIYRPGPHERESLDYEFSRVSVLERWEAGRRDLRDTLMHPEWLKHAGQTSGATQYDLTQHTRAVSKAAE